MKLLQRWLIGIVLTVLVVAIATCGTGEDKATARTEAISTRESDYPPTKPKQATLPVDITAPIDYSKVDWTELARFMYGRCGEYHDLAISVGWTEAHWKKLSFVMYRESRCNTMSFNRTDPNGGSRGLIQINGYWCKKNKYNPTGWLQAKGILNTCEDLFIPEVNLRAGLAMWNYSQERNKCGWRPWATRC